MLFHNLFYFAAADDEACDDSFDEELLIDEGSLVVMEDTETGEEYTFELVDQFEFEDNVYCVLLTAIDDEDNENFGEWVITRIVEEEGGEISLMSLDEDENDRVYDEYDRLLDAYAENEEDYEDDGLED